MPRPQIVRRLRDSLRAIARDETGAGSLFSLFLLGICVLLGGVLLDSTNAWRHRDVLQLTADVASHSGVAALARGADRDAAWKAAIAATELNTPPQTYGKIIADPIHSVSVLHYDAATNRLSKDGVPNAVRVRVERSAATQNPVPTLMLRLAGGWNIATESVAALVPTQRCDPAQGIYAAGTIRMSGLGRVGSDVCVHSQDHVVLEQTTGFDAGAVLGMPDLARCGAGCDDLLNPGSRAAAVETNLLMTPPAELIDDLAAAFVDPKYTAAEETAFFEGRPFGPDLASLEELGFDTEGVGPGSVIPLDAMTFSKLRELPSGVVFAVTCSAPKAEDDVTGVPQQVLLSGDPAPSLRHSVLVTNCPVMFDAFAKLEGALIIQTGLPNGMPVGSPLEADEKTRIGAIAASCGTRATSVVMARGDVALPANFPVADVALVVDGRLTLAAVPGSPQARHRGVALHASGEIDIAGNHAFDACTQAGTDIVRDGDLAMADDAGPDAGAFERGGGRADAPPLPNLMVIRHVAPAAGPAIPRIVPAQGAKSIVVASQ